MSWFKRPWTLDVCYFGDFLTDCTQGKSWMHLPPPFWENLLLGHLFHPHRRCKFLTQLFTEKFSRWGLCCLWQRTSYSRLGQGCPEGKWTQLVMDLLLAKEEGNPRKRQQHNQGFIRYSPIVYFERSPPKTGPVPAVRFRGVLLKCVALRISRDLKT